MTFLRKWGAALLVGGVCFSFPATMWLVAHDASHGGAIEEFEGKALREWLLVGFTGLLWLVTTFLAAYTAKLWTATSRLVEGADATARRQLRAYVFVAEVKIEAPDGPEPRADITIRNTGGTPAYKVTVSAAASAANFPPGKTIFEETPTGPESSRFVFGPDGMGRRSIPLKTLLGPGAMASLRGETGALYVYGQIRYVDAFDEPQTTDFRFMIGGDDGWPSSDLMVVCPEGNEAT